MQTHRIFPCLALLSLFLPGNLAVAQASGKWELKRDKGGIQVHVREVEGSKIKELKFTTEIEASLHSIAAILTDVEGFDNWVYASEKSETIQKISEAEVYYYTVIDFPWPLSDRDLVLHTKFWQDPSTRAIHSSTSSVHWMKPEAEDLVRITKADLRWSFTPLGNGNVRVEYYLNSDPGGSIPAWMVNLAADQGPLQTMLDFKDEIAKAKYRNARIAFVQEF